MDTMNGSLFLNASKMVESSRSWNLANDVELLKFLEKLSERIVNNASVTLNSMDNLEDSLNETFLRVRTVANKFQAIADNQFIENRVQEEDDFVLARERKTESPKVSISSDGLRKHLFESIKDCQFSLSKKFETVQISGVDSEDEMATTSPVVLVPKDVYKERRLPHLIGGSKFRTDETLGLISTDDLVENSIESEEEVDEPDRSNYKGFSAVSDEQISPQFPQFSQQFPPMTREKEESPQKPPLERLGSTTSVEEQSGRNVLIRSATPEELVAGVQRRSQSPEDNPPADFGETIFPQVLKNPLPANFAPKLNDAGTLREQLLASQKFTSFKEDLAKVLSRTKPSKRKSSLETNEPNCDVSSPSNKLEETSSQISTPESSTPSSVDAIKTPSLAKSGDWSVGSQVLPSVTTDVLENLAKGRAKVKNKRRLPSRKHRQANISDVKSNTSSHNAVTTSARTHSDDTSTQESISTQPGSNILSPATDEEDLFVLPAFDLPSDPPHGRIFFGNSLLSPGTAIDDALPNSPLFPSHTAIVENAEVPRMLCNETDTYEESAIKEPQKSYFDSYPELPQYMKNSEVENSKRTVVLRKESVDIFENIRSSTAHDSNPKPLDTITNEFDDSSTNIFSALAPENDILGVENTFSPSPPLFSNWSPPLFGDQQSEKPTVITSLRSNLTWDLLESDDLSEDLFRTHKKETSNSSSVKPKNPTNVTTSEVGIKNIFSPSSSIDADLVSVRKNKNIFAQPSNFITNLDGTLFEDDPSAPVDIFSTSKPFIGLGLKKTKSDSLFTSDDDDDDDSLFKSSESSLKPPGRNSLKPQGMSIDVKEKSLGSSKSSTKQVVVDPLMSIDQLE